MTHGIALALALLSLPSLALAQAAPAATAPAAAVTEQSPDMIYAAALGRGLTAVRAGDRGGAIAAFREAVQLQPSRPDAVCFLAEAQRASGDLAAALEGFQACARVARGWSHHDAQRWVARGLHGAASTLERMGPERQAEARTAWQEYVRFADGAAQVSSPAIGRARVTAIDQVTELERVTAEVRERIAARAAQAQSSPPPSR